MKNAADRATDLLIQRITEGLDPQSERELEALLADRPDLDAESFELAAAAIELTVTDTTDALPPSLRQRLSSQAQDFFEQPEASRTDDVEATPANVVPMRQPAQRAGRAGSLYSNLGWLAAAATLIFSIALWPKIEGPGIDGPGIDPSTPTTPIVTPGPAAPAPSEERAELIAQATDLLKLAWTSTDETSEAGGEVVWSTASQRGFMTFRGLPVNDPSVEQYQLWIFDAEQDERYPVDGGVFDVNDAGETIVEIDAKLEIKTPTLFAITVEKPGGVVVSSRERLPLLAQVG